MKPWQKSLVWICVAISLLAIYQRGKALSLDRHPTDRLRYHAIPVALSSVYHRWPHDYTALKGLAAPFQSGDALEDLIAWGVAYQADPDEGTYYWVADDRGMGDYVVMAFRLFGPHLNSLYLFYFVVLGVSCALFLVEAHDNSAMSALLILVLAAMYSALPVIPLANVTTWARESAAFEPVTLYEPRTIELLSLIATLHLALAGLAGQRWTPIRIAAASVQAILLAFCYHARSTVGWQVLFVAAMSAVNLAWSRYAPMRSSGGDREHRAGLSRTSALVPLGLVAIAFVGLAVYKHIMYNPRYFEDKGSRTVWHNALMGLGADGSLGEQYRLRVSDGDVVTAVIGYLKETGDPRLNASWTTQNILASLGSNANFNWFVYEDAAEDLYWHFWRAHPRAMLRYYLRDKPHDVMALLINVSATSPIAQRNARQLYFNPLSGPALLIAVPAWLVVWTARPKVARFVVGTLLLCCFSLIPGYVFYPVPLTMMGACVSLALMLYVTVAFALGGVSRSVAERAG
jgi:hypothetical protein